jgi:hypothetical protein
MNNQINQTTIETGTSRLRASKEVYEAEQFDQGFNAGRNWATNDAEYGQLKAVSNIFLSNLVEYSPGLLLNEIFDGEPLSSEDYENVFGVTDPSNEFVGGFAEGAYSIYKQV